MYYNAEQEILTIEELCEFLLIGKNTAYQLLNSKEIVGFKIGTHWKIPKEAVLQFIKKQTGLSS